jgi:hypothetical protein
MPPILERPSIARLVEAIEEHIPTMETLGVRRGRVGLFQLGC